MALELQPTMGRKKSERNTTMVRTYVEFADTLRQAAGERNLSAAEFCEQFLQPCVEKAHRDYIKAESKRLTDKA